MSESLYLEVLHLQRLLTEMSERLDKERKRATDAEYFMLAYYNMLGTKGKMVADKWINEGTKRVHYSWGPSAKNMTGEERAEYILYMDLLLEQATPVESIDSDLPTYNIRDVIAALK